MYCLNPHNGCYIIDDHDGDYDNDDNDDNDDIISYDCLPLKSNKRLMKDCTYQLHFPCCGLDRLWSLSPECRELSEFEFEFVRSDC